MYRLGVVAVLMACVGSGLEDPLQSTPSIGALRGTSHRDCQFALPRAATLECVADPEELDRTGVTSFVCLTWTHVANTDGLRFRLLLVKINQPDVLPATPENLNNCLQT
ncbi:MAG: hypothetical protein KDA87_07760 [Planctomycetales bacterium]|nr:hypothetical protein [Planctomycetales bacterium]